MQKGPVLFDTNILIDLFSGHQEAQQVLEAYPPQNAISLITWMEVMVGAKKYHQEYRTRVALSAFNIIGVSQEIAERSVNLRQEYGMKLPDAIILATAQIHRFALVTRNTRDFAGIPGVITPYQLQAGR
ncbi:TPA: type II toxin-antitoxin system VapC family toxin [Citrobacter amalonaticus]|uniref:Ribonuclease VapC n=1 Tax=Citrobacter amalonaticus TaxID=35703 RepID=A0A9C7V492_CITAM|nr:type II toxin-antitoxin system VapC family toxin [Citrobacter amalonaticus]